MCKIICISYVILSKGEGSVNTHVYAFRFFTSLFAKAHRKHLLFFLIRYGQNDKRVKHVIIFISLNNSFIQQNINYGKNYF